MISLRDSVLYHSTSQSNQNEWCVKLLSCYIKKTNKQPFCVVNSKLFSIRLARGILRWSNLFEISALASIKGRHHFVPSVNSLSLLADTVHGKGNLYFPRNTDFSATQLFSLQHTAKMSGWKDAKRAMERVHIVKKDVAKFGRKFDKNNVRAFAYLSSSILHP